jgi:hypothetical protein
MSKVRKWDGEGTFAGTRGNDGLRPESAARKGVLGAISSTVTAWGELSEDWVFNPSSGSPP